VRYLPPDTLRDIGDVIDRDPDQAQIMIGVLVGELIDMHYRLLCRWRPKGKRVLADLETWDVTAAVLARQSCHGTVADRFVALTQLMQHVLAPVGGPMPLAWRTNWEDLER
jgi:hypothetical protein